MRMNRVLPIASLLAGLVLTGGAVAAQEIRWDLSDEHAPSTISGIADARFAELVKEKSGGRIEITVHYGAALGIKSADHFTAVEDGAVTLASTPFSRFGGINPIFEFQSLPFIAPTIDQAEKLTNLLLPIYDNVFDKANQKLLFTVPWLQQGFWAAKAVNKADDLKGLKIRTIDMAAAETLKRAGADAIQMSWGDVLPALSTGTINAVVTSSEGGVSAKLWEVGIKYFNNAGLTMDVSAVTVNRDSFNALPDDLQLAVLAAAVQTQAYVWAYARDRYAELSKTATQNGITMNDNMPPELIQHLRAAAGPVIEEWKKRLGEKVANDLLSIYDKKN